MKREILFYGKLVLAVVFVAAVGWYVYYQSRNYISGPTVSIAEPKAGSLSTEPVIDIAGVAKNISEIMLDGQPIFVDEAGNFKERRALLPGYNIFQVVVKDKFQRNAIQNVEVVYKPES